MEIYIKTTPIYDKFLYLDPCPTIEELHSKLLGADVSSRAHFAKVKSTLTPYFTPVIPSLLNISTIFVSYPILLAETKHEEENYNNSTTTIADAFQRYSPENIFDIVKEQQEEARKNNEFYGTVYADINMTTMVKLLETQSSQKIGHRYPFLIEMV